MFFLLNGYFWGKKNYSAGRLYFITKREKSKIKRYKGKADQKNAEKSMIKNLLKKKCISSRQKSVNKKVQ